MKKIATTLLLLSSMAIAGAETTAIDQVNYILNDDGTATVTNMGQSPLTEIVIPSTVTSGGKSYTVTVIGEKAFYNNKTATSITVPETVTRVERWAFYSCANAVFNIPSKLTFIGDRAYQRCNKLKAANLPATVTHIGDDAFGFSTALTEASIPPSILSLIHI